MRPGLGFPQIWFESGMELCTSKAHSSVLLQYLSSVFFETISFWGLLPRCDVSRSKTLCSLHANPIPDPKYRSLVESTINMEQWKDILLFRITELDAQQEIILGTTCIFPGKVRSTATRKLATLGLKFDSIIFCVGVFLITWPPSPVYQGTPLP